MNPMIPDVVNLPRYWLPMTIRRILSHFSGYHSHGMIQEVMGY